MKLLIAGIGIFLLTLAGCGLEMPNSRPRLSERGIPTDTRYIVGAGVAIFYKAPQPGGIAILVDRTHNRPVLTKSLDPGEEFTLPQMLEHPDAIKFFGPNPAKNEYVLYFIPHPVTAATQPGN